MNNQICSISGCEADTAYAVIDDKKCYRITFSRSLAWHIKKTSGKRGLKVRRVKLHLEKQLEAGQVSTTGLYAICKAKSGWPLRVTFFKDLASMWKNDTTSIYECKISLG